MKGTNLRLQGMLDMLIPKAYANQLRPTPHTPPTTRHSKTCAYVINPSIHCKVVFEAVNQTLNSRPSIQPEYNAGSDCHRRLELEPELYREIPDGHSQRCTFGFGPLAHKRAHVRPITQPFRK